MSPLPLRLFHATGSDAEDSALDGPNGSTEPSKRRREDTSSDDEQTADDRRYKRACQWDSDDYVEDDWDNQTPSESEVESVVERMCQHMRALWERNEENSRGQDGEMEECGENQASEGEDPSGQNNSEIEERSSSRNEESR